LSLNTYWRTRDPRWSDRVCNLAQAIALIGNERPDAIILDLNLNGQSGHPVAEALAADDVPFVIVSRSF